MFAFIFFVKNLSMTKKDYIFNMTSLIINRLKFHAPILQEDFIDFDKVISFGVDPTLPVFCFDKPMTKIMAKCFKQVQKSFNFNLVLAREDKNAEKLHPIYTKNSEVRKLNVNYKSGLKFDYKPSEDYIKINGKALKKSLNGFFKESFTDEGNICYYTSEFVLSGHNIYLEFLNKTDREQQINFEINFDLGRGYYYFRKTPNCLQISNLYTLQKTYFNFSNSCNNFAFSCVDGVENSTYARVYLSCTQKIKPRQKKVFFFNYGSQKFVLRNLHEIEFFRNLCQEKNSEKFDVKIISSDKREERLINFILPQKIYSAWLAGKRDFESEKRYTSLKEKYAIKSPDGYVLNDISSLLQIKLWAGKSYKTVLIANDVTRQNCRYLQVNDEKIFDKNYVSLKQLNKKNSGIFVD